MSKLLAQEELVARLGEREVLQIAGTGDWNTPEGRALDEAAIARELEHADSVVLGYVLGRHPWVDGLDTADMPDLLKGFAADIARYRLHDRAGNAGSIAETVKDRYRDAMAQLRDLASGKLDLPRERDGRTVTESSSADFVRHTGGGSRTAGMIEEYLA